MKNTIEELQKKARAETKKDCLQDYSGVLSDEIIEDTIEYWGKRTDALISTTAQAVREKMVEKIENMKESHTHNSIPSFTADLEEGCVICRKNQTIKDIIKLLKQ